MLHENAKLRRTARTRRVTVVVPVLNESETIASVVALAKQNSLVGEVLVVDDGSIDGTPQIAAAAGARVVTSTMLGKGASMEDGLREASHDVVLYLDGDLRGLCSDVVERMVTPLLLGTADFVKAKFTRAAGRVTVLTAKPLLRTYFPEIAAFEQPLSGIMAARATVLRQCWFENDYGVDVGLFIDAALNGARLAEVDIGSLEHDSHPLDVLGDMATQVARTVLDRAARHGRLRTAFMREVKERERLLSAHGSFMFERFSRPERLALFDMDGVLLNGRFVSTLAERAGRTDQLAAFLDNFGMTAEQRMRRIAQVFAGVPRALFEATAREIPLTPGAIDAVVGLRKLGYRVGIVTDSYHLASEIVRRRVFADFSFAHLMRFSRGKATGRITICPAMIHEGGCSIHDHCKVNVLHHLSEKLGVAASDVLAVGDGMNDVCLLGAAGRSCAFEPKQPEVAAAAQQVLTGSLADLPALVDQSSVMVEIDSQLCAPVLSRVQSARRNSRASRN